MLIGTGRIVSFVMTAWRPRGLEKMSVPINLYSVYGGLFLTHEPHGTGIMSELVVSECRVISKEGATKV